MRLQSYYCILPEDSRETRAIAKALFQSVLSILSNHWEDLDQIRDDSKFLFNSTGIPMVDSRATVFFYLFDPFP